MFVRRFDALDPDPLAPNGQGTEEGIRPEDDKDNDADVSKAAGGAHGEDEDGMQAVVSKATGECPVPPRVDARVDKGQRRADRGELKKAQRLPTGWLKFDGFLTRTGVFTYRNPDGSERKELRLPEEVFNKDSLASFELVPVTNDHPPMGYLDANTAREFGVGSIGTPKADGDHVRSTGLVTNGDAIKDMEAGKQELSCGYSCDLEYSPGVYQGERYDAIQRNIRGNHVAIVTAGRAGPTARLRIDSDISVMVASDIDVIAPSSPRKSGATVRKIKIDGKWVEVSDAVAEAYEAEQTKREDAAKASKADFEKLQARFDAQADELKAVKAAHADAADPKHVQAAVRARVALENTARAILGEGPKLDTMSDAEIKGAVVTHGSPDFKAEGKSADYLQARFDAAVEKFNADDQPLANARRAATEDSTEEASDLSPMMRDRRVRADAEPEREAAMLKTQAMWKRSITPGKAS